MSFWDSTKKYLGAAVGGTGGFLGGAKAGVTVGALFGPPGIVVGAIGGGLAGMLYFGKQGYENPSSGMINGVIAIGSAAAASQMPDTRNTSIQA